MSVKLAIPSLFLPLVAYYLNPSIFQPLLDIISPLKPAPKNANLFTSADLKLYNGIDKPDLYLSILGQVYDVTKGAAHYGPKQTYNFFIGRDSSRSFVTGKFGANDADDKVADLPPDDLRSLNHWVQFYRKDYKRVGKLIGRYYDESGKLTKYGKEVKRLIKKAEAAQQSLELEKIQYPPCNIEWDPDRGTRVWCTNKSGGIARTWVGFPRQFYEPGSQNYRCACIQTSDLTGNLKQYEGCDSESESCFVK